MRKLWSLALVAGLLSTVACDNSLDPTPNDDNTTLEVLEGSLETMTLDADKQYLLKGQVFVRDGKTLTIPAGTVIFGEKRSRATLIIDKGGKIEAVGTAEKPIIMTSAQEPGERDRGDWGGVVILGRANVNQPDPAIEGITPEVLFGTFQSTTHDNESSGTLKYVRIEYAGIELTPNNETNSLTMGGVGRGTEMEHIMVSFGGDDGFEWFGGTVNGKYLISHSTWDDDFDCDYGWSGNVQFGLAVRNPFFADQSQSNAFECDNGPNDNDVQPYTTGTFSNVTVYGPRDNSGRSISANNANGMHLRRRTAVSIFNSVITGFPTALRLDLASTLGQYQEERGVLANNILVAPNTDIASNADVNAVRTIWEDKNLATVSGEIGDANYDALGLRKENFFAKYTLASYPANPNFTLTSGTLSSGAKFDYPKFNENLRSDFFDKNVQFIGAFGSSDWTDGWAEFNPLEKAYKK